MSLIDDYQLLEIPTTATEQEAKAAFKRLARRYHPDKNPHTDTTALFQRLQQAHENVTSAIRQSAIVQDWKPFTFTKENTQSSGAKNRYRYTSSASDQDQEAFVKERQRAYEEMKRNNAQHEKARDEAIQAARNSLNEKRVKALYEEAHKASREFSTDGIYENKPHAQGAKADTTQPYTTHNDIPPYDAFIDNESSSAETSTLKTSKVTSNFYRKTALHAALCLAFFTAGIVIATYWPFTADKSSDEKPMEIYISGLYPQFRVGDSHTLAETNLHAEPSTNSSILEIIPAQADIQGIKLQGDWLTVRYQGVNGWVKTQNIGFGSHLQAQQTGCIGQPGAAPQHGELIGEAQGSSRLRILNQLPTHSILRFESYDGRAPFSIYLHPKRAYAANYIPHGNYRMVLTTGSLYHHACNQFLFDGAHEIILDKADFASTEQTLSLMP